MANIASVEYVFDGDPKQLEELGEVIETASMLNDDHWDLFTITTLLGIDTTEIGHALRGDITDFIICRDSKNTITSIRMSCDCAWEEQRDFRLKIISEKFPYIKTYYIEEETGCEIFNTNDVHQKYFSEKYLIDIEDCDIEYYESLDDVKGYIERNTDLSISESADFKEVFNTLKDWCGDIKTFTLLEINYV